MVHRQVVRWIRARLRTSPIPFLMWTMVVGAVVRLSLWTATAQAAPATFSWFTAPANDGPSESVLLGPDGSVWFQSPQAIGRVDASGFHSA